MTKWKNVGKKLPSTNPCHYVTGKAPKKWRSGEGYASYWDTQNGVGDAGFDYQQVLDCFGREDYRLRQDLQDELDAAKSAKDINVAFAGLKFPCAFVPGPVWLALVTHCARKSFLSDGRGSKALAQES